MKKYEEINDFIIDETKFDKNTLANAELEISCRNICNSYFTPEAVAIHENCRVVYIPYDQLQSISLYEIKPVKGYFKPRHSCYYWLKNGMEYHSPLDSSMDFEKISTYMANNHPEIEVDANSNKGGRIF